MIVPISDCIELAIGPGWLLALAYAFEPLDERHSRATLTAELLAATVRITTVTAVATTAYFAPDLIAVDLAADGITLRSTNGSVHTVIPLPTDSDVAARLAAFLKGKPGIALTVTYGANGKPVTHTVVLPRR